MSTVFVGGIAAPVVAVDLKTSTVSRPTLRARPTEPGGVRTLVFNHDDTRACICNQSGQPNLWMYDTRDMSTWELLWSAQATNSFFDAIFGPDGSWLACAPSGEKTMIFDTETGEPKFELDLLICSDVKETGGFNSTFGVSARLLVGSGGADTADANLVKLWRIADLGLQRTPAQARTAYELTVKGGAGPVALSPDNRFLARRRPRSRRARPGLTFIAHLAPCSPGFCHFICWAGAYFI